MDTISKLYLRISELEQKIEQCIDDDAPEFIPDYQEELDSITRKLTHLENDIRKTKTKKNLGIEQRIV